MRSLPRVRPTFVSQLSVYQGQPYWHASQARLSMGGHIRSNWIIPQYEFVLRRARWEKIYPLQYVTMTEGGLSHSGILFLQNPLEFQG